MKVFLDTNVLASSIATRGLCSELLENVIHDHELLTCQQVLRELERILAGKFGLPAAVISGFLALLEAQARLVASRKSLPIPIKDSDDVAILACALAGEADVFVTGDKELLDLKRIENLVILSPRELWLQLRGLSPLKS